MQDNLGGRLLRILQTKDNESRKPTLPDELLYDDSGLPIWNEIISTREFYQTHDEVALFEQHGEKIAKRVKSGVTMIDLGAGCVFHCSYFKTFPAWTDAYRAIHMKSC